MLQTIKNWLQKIKLKLPENKLKKNYFEMLQKLKELEKQVDSNAKQLELAKSSFLKNLYHEIRSPLNAIMGFTNLLAKDYKISDKEKEEYLSLINKSSNEFLRTIDDIIQASLLEAGMIKISSDVCNISLMLNELHSYFTIRKHMLEKNCVALLLSIPENCQNVNIICDKYRLNQILNNILENALKFTDMGSIEFGCSIKNAKLEFFIKDTGIGDLEGKENYLFSRFAKIDVSDNSKNGLGLGLSNSKKILELMDGKIWYTSNKNKGTCFYFTIPFIAAESLPDETKKQSGLFENVLRNQNSLAV